MGSKELTEQLQLLLRLANQEAGRSLKQVSEETGLPYSCVHGFDGGGGVSGSTLNRIARYLRVRLWDPQRKLWIDELEEVEE